MNTRLYVFFAMVTGFVVAFVLHIQSLECRADTPEYFDLECHKMYMSFGVLFCIGILLLVSGGIYILQNPPEDKQEFPARNVFDSFTKQLVPIATLVLGYYFGTSVQTPAAPEKRTNGHEARAGEQRPAVTEAPSGQDARGKDAPPPAR